jgi:hypothetical protein
MVRNLMCIIGKSGCIVYERNTKPNLKKLEDLKQRMIFLGYERGTKAYMAYDPITKQVTITRNVVFDEGTQLSWCIEDVTEANDVHNSSGSGDSIM